MEWSFSDIGPSQIVCGCPLSPLAGRGDFSDQYPAIVATNPDMHEPPAGMLPTRTLVKSSARAMPPPFGQNIQGFAGLGREMALGAPRLRPAAGSSRAQSQRPVAAAASARPAFRPATRTGRHADASGRNPRPGPACRRTSPPSRSESPRSDRRRRRCRAAPLRRSAQNCTASVRLWRRFIRFRIMSLPACRERCRCGINRGSLAIASEKLVIRLDTIDRGQS